jgi:hypothetical protein
MNNPLQCVSYNLQDPLVRSITSELVCALNIQSVEIVQKAMKNAFYMAIERANIIHDIPMAVNKKEKFSIKYNAQTTVTEADIVFDTRGMLKWEEDLTEAKIIYEYG